MEAKDVQNKRCCIRTEDDRGTLPQGSKVEGRKKRCSALTRETGPVGAKEEEEEEARHNSEDSDEVYSGRRDSDDNNSDKVLFNADDGSPCSWANGHG